MNDIIHDNIEAAKKACQEYLEGVQALQEQLGVSEESDGFFIDEDNGACTPGTILIAQYWDEKGVLKSFGL
jgi:hypothetical protein